MQEDLAIYYPMLVSDGSVDQDIVALWQEFNALPIRFRDILTSRELPKILRNIQIEYGLSNEMVAQVSRLIRWLFFQKLTWEEFGVRIESILFAAQGNGERLKELLERIKTEILSMNPTQVSIEDEIFEDNPEVSTTSVIDPKNLRSLPILKALSEYPELHYQRITDEKILIKGEREPVAPTVRNWLRAYRDELGVGHHTNVERGQFLFQGKNTKNLSAAEREVVATIVKSLDDETPMTIDVSKKTFLFQKGVSPEIPGTELSSAPTMPEQPVFRFEPSAGQPGELPQESLSGEISFSSSHKLPGEQDEWSTKDVA